LTKDKDDIVDIIGEGIGNGLMFREDIISPKKRVFLF
jgi:hypothetical protein